MNATGIIVEYNPLHKGHLYHIEETKKRSKCDVLIAVMSGNFVQRGEPAILNKQIRAKQALESGVDIVIELPYLYSVQSADFFASGAIKLLDALQVTNLYFGSESGDINELQTVARYIDHNDFNSYIKDAISKGVSYPVASSNALRQFTDFHLAKPNDILGVRYIKSIRSLGSQIKPFTIKRLKSNYHDETISESTIASATSIRKSILTNQNKRLVEHVVSSNVYEDLISHKLTSWSDFFPYLKYKILTSGDQLMDIHQMSQEICNRIQKFIRTSSDFNTLIKQLTTKRLTRSRLQRVLTNVLVDLKKREVGDAKLEHGPDHLRILGINKIGQDYIKEQKKSITLPIITNITKDTYHYVALDEQVADLYHLIDNKKKRNIPVFG